MCHFRQGQVKVRQLCQRSRIVLARTRGHRQSGQFQMFGKTPSKGLHLFLGLSIERNLVMAPLVLSADERNYNEAPNAQLIHATASEVMHSRMGEQETVRQAEQHVHQIQKRPRP